jgi:tetratricopeptide (TPR) repeat protein
MTKATQTGDLGKSWDGTSEVEDSNQANTNKTEKKPNLKLVSNNFEKATVPKKKVPAQVAARLAEISDLEDQVAARPNDSSAWAKLGKKYLDELKHGKARKALQKSLEINPDQPVALKHYGLLLESSGKLKEAVEHFEHYLINNSEDKRIEKIKNRITDRLADTGQWDIRGKSFPRNCMYKRQAWRWHAMCT